MNPLKKLFQQTFIYGLATVLPRMISFILVMIHTGAMMPNTYGDVSLVFAWFAIFNVVLAYGMETAFFRFFHKEDDKDLVVSTSLISILLSTISFATIAFLFKNTFSSLLEVNPTIGALIIGILALDALTVVPFAWLRAKERPIKYSIVKVVSVAINFGLNIFLLITLPKLANGNSESYWAKIYIENFQPEYVFIANLVASAVALLWICGLYFDNSYRFSKILLKKMLKYALPVMIAGIAFTINEVVDRILLSKLISPENVAKTEIGMYSACYKLAAFMTLFGTAFRLGVEPFFFSHAETENPQKTYAHITTYFVIIGSVIFLGVLVFANPLKELFIRDEAYWEAMKIVPIVLLASFCLGIYHNLSVWYKVTDKTRFGAYISSIGAILTLLINFIFIPKYGYLASAWATLIAYGSMMCLSYYLGRKHYPIPYNMRKIFFYSFIAIGFALISFYGFNRNLIVGSLLLLVFLGLIYKLEGDKLKKIFLKSES
ncbi:lipopolysaccharide biosynthesis protein [Croceivirga lutea]|uniref:lipopolysaccharide biosynthesis protein n=1 Tax=Croceivirga lutea TaxID=1775167 RepID=UPI00163B452F|nr:oligosaccharide flippase family protein [Croceivirga lutea]